MESLVWTIIETFKRRQIFMNKDTLTRTPITMLKNNSSVHKLSPGLDRAMLGCERCGENLRACTHIAQTELSRLRLRLEVLFDVKEGSTQTKTTTTNLVGQMADKAIPGELIAWIVLGR
eukprot:5785979-Amphidinium_carterae.1